MSDPSFAGVYLTNSDSGHMDEQVDTNMIEEALHEPNKFHIPNSNNTTSFTMWNLMRYQKKLIIRQ